MPKYIFEINYNTSISIIILDQITDTTRTEHTTLIIANLKSL